MSVSALLDRPDRVALGAKSFQARMHDGFLVMTYYKVDKEGLLQ